MVRACCERKNSFVLWDVLPEHTLAIKAILSNSDFTRIIGSPNKGTGKCPQSVDNTASIAFATNANCVMKPPAKKKCIGVRKHSRNY